MSETSSEVSETLRHLAQSLEDPDVRAALTDAEQRIAAVAAGCGKCCSSSGGGNEKPK